jgi:hypothetical protein
MTIHSYWKRNLKEQPHTPNKAHEKLTLFNAEGKELDELGEQMEAPRAKGATDHNYRTSLVDIAITRARQYRNRAMNMFVMSQEEKDAIATLASLLGTRLINETYKEHTIRLVNIAECFFDD